MAKNYVLIPAAGSGSRLGEVLPKQYLPLLGKPLIHHTLAVFCAHPDIARVYVVISPHDTNWIDYADAKVQVLRCGGDTRAASVLGGLLAMVEEVAADDWVLVHDAARPCLSRELLDRLLKALGNDAVGGLLAVPVADTLKRASPDGCIVRTEPREGLWRAQTPQMFRYGLLSNALIAMGADTPTDEAQAVESFGHTPRLVLGEEHNLKVTYAEDLVMAELILQGRYDTNLRIGHGFDVHQLVAGRSCIIGGVDIPHEKGLAGHSDADVLLHAICDALLGASALGDIGKHFPNTDPRYQGIDSRKLLRHVVGLLRDKGYAIRNIDATVIAEAPMLSLHIPAMCANIAADTGLAADAVNVKATTSEKLGFLGRGEGIAAEAVCLIVKAA